MTVVPIYLSFETYKGDVLIKEKATMNKLTISLFLVAGTVLTLVWTAFKIGIFFWTPWATYFGVLGVIACLIGFAGAWRKTARKNTQKNKKAA